MSRPLNLSPRRFHPHRGSDIIVANRSHDPTSAQPALRSLCVRYKRQRDCFLESCVVKRHERITREDKDPPTKTPSVSLDSHRRPMQCRVSTRSRYSEPFSFVPTKILSPERPGNLTSRYLEAPGAVVSGCELLFTRSRIMGWVMRSTAPSGGLAIV